MAIGILIVGIGGNNGVTLLAGHIANRKNLTWESSTQGPMTANWLGCVTQLEPRGKYGGVGFANRGYDLASATDAIIGGWDIRSTPLGDALYQSRVLEYDLVRQVREEMNTTIPILRGVWDPNFIGESQHETATHVVTDQNVLKSTRTKVEYLRHDIREFIRKNNITDHTTVIWSASVERPADVSYGTADELLNAIYDDDNTDDISPSMLYAVAAALEGCSFVNGGSQNTLSPGLSELFEQSYRNSEKPPPDAPLGHFLPCSTGAAYTLGTDFKAGQTKFKTAVVEYARALGLTPRVIASSNHLGNNDMRNLLSKKTLDAKMRVKSDIFGPWDERDLDHQVTVMYTPYIGDEKRDVVEYTSLGFLGSPHTMLTYTRCMDSILCVPLMVDAAVWCDYFARMKCASDAVARATAYLFKVPEGGARGVDPGFFNQMSVLESTLKLVASPSPTGGTSDVGNTPPFDVIEEGVRHGIISEEQANALHGLTK